MLNPPSSKKSCCITGPVAFSVGVVYTDQRSNNQAVSNSRQRIFGPEVDPKAENEVNRLQVAKENVENNYRRDWAQQLQKKVVGHHARREYDRFSNSYQEHLEERKSKLSALLNNETIELISEMESASKPTPVAYTDILEKINCFREERDERRREIVKAKLDLQFMSECEELRPKLSAQLAEAVLADRREQVREHESLKKMKKLEDEYYDCLWHADYLNKLHQEEQKALERHARNMDTLVTLNKQMCAKQMYKEQVAELGKQEAKILAEERQRFELEKEKELQERQKKKMELKETIEANIAQSESKKVEEKNRGQEFDSFYKNFLGSSAKSSDTIAKIQRLKEAQENLRLVLAEKAEKVAREMESDRLIQLDNDKLWEKYSAVKEVEEEKRRILLEETMEGRRIQVQQKISENEKHQLEIKKEVESLQEMIEFNRKLFDDDEERHKNTVKKYKEIILNQIEEHKAEQKAKDEELRQEYDKFCSKEEAYKKKIEQTLLDVSVGKLHPMRIRAAVKPDENHGETDTMVHMQMRINQLEETLQTKKKQISEKTTHTSQKMEQFNNILSYYNPED